jgi:nucleotide-binding universal stress UspA family protein
MDADGVWRERSTAMKILLTLDGSEFAEAAIPLARRLATIPGAEMHLLTVVEPELARIDKDDGRRVGEVGVAWLTREDDEDGTEDALPADVEMALEHYLEEVARGFENCIVHPALRVGPHPAEQIAAYVEANGIELVVMATHGRTGLNQMVHGSVAAAVLRCGVAPVALVRPR